MGSVFFDINGYLSTQEDQDKKKVKVRQRNDYDMNREIYKNPMNTTVPMKSNTLYGCSTLAPTDVRSSKHDSFEAKVYRKTFEEEMISQSANLISTASIIKHQSSNVSFPPVNNHSARVKKKCELII